MVAGVPAPTEAEVEVYFILQREKYMTPEARRVVHALVYVPPTAGREEWQRAERSARALAREVAEDNLSLLEAADSLREQVPPRFKDQVGDIGYVHRGSLTPAVDEAVFAAEPGSVTEPVATIYGYHVLQVVDARPPRPLELFEVRDAVAERYVIEQRQRKLQKFERELREMSVVKVTGCADTL
jgi:parvulin-like peptidyl-prolyl isomerase